MTEEGVKLEMELSDQIFDLLIIGTGTTESIIASALAKAGKKVLHTDAADYYGGDYSSFNLKSLVEFCESNSSFIDDNHSIVNTIVTNDNTSIDMRNSLSSSIRVLEFSTEIFGNQQSISSATDQLSFHPSCEGYDMIKSTESHENYSYETNTHPCFYGYSLTITAGREVALRKSEKLKLLSESYRRFNLDLTFQMTLSVGDTVETMVNSGVSKYLEFRNLDAIYYLENKKMTPVPTSKGDIFKSNLLSILEKRQLMKFLQIVLDHVRLLEGEMVMTVNERQLGSGSALTRPQNKAMLPASEALIVEESRDLCEYLDLPFENFLALHKVSQKLQSLIVHALCLHALQDPTSLRTREALHALSRHMNSLGRYGSTAFLLPLYGSGEIPQAFCRCCAVWGGVYMLRTTVDRIQLPSPPSLDESNHSSALCSADEKNTPTNAAHGPSEQLITVTDSTGQSYKCRRLVCAAERWSNPVPFSAYLLTRLCILDGPLSPGPNSLLIIPPNTPTIDNVNAVYSFQLDSSLNICPNDFIVLYISTIVSKEIYSPEAAKSLMNRLVRYFLSESSNKSTTELFFVTTARPLFQSNQTASLPNNIALTVDKDFHLDCHACIKQAEEVVHKLFPDMTTLFEPVGVVDDDVIDDLGL